MHFEDRADAGRRLAALLVHLRAEDPVVVGLPRGGVVVAAEVARELGAPLETIGVRKLGAPPQPELAMGAVGEDGVVILHDEVVSQLRITREEIDAEIRRQVAEMGRRIALFRGGRERQPLEGRTVILVDDGLATGMTARAGARVIKNAGARRTVLAVPVASDKAVRDLSTEVDDVVAVQTPRSFYAIGEWYRDFAQTSDEEVISLLESHPASASTREVDLPIAGVQLEGSLTQVVDASGIVVFAHGSGSSRLSPRNVQVARALNESGLSTLLFDLLTPAEAELRENVFDIALLAGRVAGAVDWVSGDAPRLPIGLFGASTGAAAALAASVVTGGSMGAVVSRGGRPDLAGEALEKVKAPTLLIVGSLDTNVLDLNRRAQARLPGPCELRIVPGAGHLFEEHGTMDQVTAHAIEWFTRWLK